MGRGRWNLFLRDRRPLIVRHAIGADAPSVLAHRDVVCAETDFLSFGPGERERTVDWQAEILSELERSEVQIQLLAFVGAPASPGSSTDSPQLVPAAAGSAEPDASALVGALAFTTRDLPRLRHSGEIGMTVRKAYWGLGVGAHLMGCLLEWARAHREIRKLNLRVRTDNARAIRLYERQGFQIEGTIACDFSVGGVDYDHHWMGLRL